MKNRGWCFPSEVTHTSNPEVVVDNTTTTTAVIRNSFLAIMMEDDDDAAAAAAAAAVFPETWEEIDVLLFEELRAQKLSLLLKTSERRLFAIVSMNIYLFQTLTNLMGWCTMSALSFVSGFSPIIEKLHQKIKKHKAELYNLQQKVITSKYRREDVQGLLQERHAELTDPDKKIWAELLKRNLVQKHVAAEYAKVDRSRLPENEAAFNYKIRRGRTVLETSAYIRSTRKIGNDDYDHIDSFEFFEKYMRSDESLAASNKLSVAYSVPLEVLPNITVNVPRRIERYMNSEVEYMTRLCASTVSNYTRGFILSYLVGRIFGCAYLTSQMYMKAFADSVVARSPFFINKATKKEQVTLSYSRMRLVLKSTKGRESFINNRLKFAGSADTIMTYPASFMSGGGAPSLPSPSLPNNNKRKVILEASDYTPSRMDKLAVSYMRSPIAEHPIDGPLAEWLAIKMSFLLGRRVDPQYALLLLANWALEQLEHTPEYLKRITSALQLIFHHDSGLTIPNIGFGVGMTPNRLKCFARILIMDVIRPLVYAGLRNKPPKEPKTHVAETNYDKLLDIIGGNKNCQLARENSDLVVMSSGLFTNNEVTNKRGEEPATTPPPSSGDDDNDGCRCGCHRNGGSLSGLRFDPSEERRAIHETEYNKMLMSQPHLLTEFGVCGYQYALTASNDKNLLVKLQLLKERLIFTQRETAAAIGWSRLLQFYFTNGDDKKKSKHTTTPCGRSKYDVYNVKDKLYKINRRYIEHFSTLANTSIVCDRTLEYLTAKFNTILLPLGRKPDPFLRTKAGKTILDHARHHLRNVYASRGEFDKADKVKSEPVPAFMLEMAKKCVTGYEQEYAYHVAEPFLACDSNRVDGVKDESPAKVFRPIPLFGVDRPIYDMEYVIDQTATKTSQNRSVFKIKKDDASFTEANISRGVLSCAKIVNNLDTAKLILTKNNSCVPIFKGIREIFQKDMDTERPRRMDDHSPWSSKTTGQSGRNTTEFNVNSVVLVVQYELDEEGNPDPDNYDDDIYLQMVDNQRSTVQNDLKHPVITAFSTTDSTEVIEAPDYSPVYRHGVKSVALTLK